MQKDQRETTYRRGPELSAGEQERVVELLSAGIERLMRMPTGSAPELAIDRELCRHERDLTAGEDGSREPENDGEEKPD
jgi:hypothetical protein